jgi:hypothetical protein
LTDALKVSCFLICGIFCFTTLDTEVLASQEPGKGEFSMQMLCLIVAAFSEKTCANRLGERVSVVVSDGVRMTTDAMRFSDWDDTHTHNISFVVKQAVKGIFIAHR